MELYPHGGEMDTQAYTEAGTVFKKRRRQISLTAFMAGATCQVDQNTRGRCTGWNDRIGSRAGAYVENFRQDFRVFGTLTYSAAYPRSGKAVKNDWRAFIERLRRVGWLDKGSIFWWLEFQARGAPHFHYLATEWVGKCWVADAWADITDGDARSCSRVEAIKHPDRIGSYVSKYIQKAEQKEIPFDFVDVGRMWGISGPKICGGLPRLPVVAAATNSGPPSRFADIIAQARIRFGVRVATTMRGYVLFGTEKNVEDTWRYLAANIVIIGLTERKRESSRLGTLDGW
jgi:hypothetical protein